jgi:hypothetical protein
VLATKDSSLSGTNRVSPVVSVVTLVSGFHRQRCPWGAWFCPFCPRMMDDCDSALIVPVIIIVTIYASDLFQASFVSSCRIVSDISLCFLQLLRIQFLGGLVWNR